MLAVILRLLRLFAGVALRLSLYLVALWAVIAWFTNPGHRIYTNANVLTMNEAQPRATAFATKGDRIIAVGSEAELLARKRWHSRVVDMQGRTVLPGFIDAHGHFPGWSDAGVMVDLSPPPVGDTASIAMAQAALKAAAQNTKPGDWVLAVGFDDSVVAEKRHINRDDLDAVSTQHPVMVIHVSGHFASTNSLGLELAGIDASTPDPEGGHIRRYSEGPRAGEPNGVLDETARLVMVETAMQLSMEQIWALFSHGSNYYLRQGFSSGQSGLTAKGMLQGFGLLAKLGLLKPRLTAWPDQEAAEQWLDGDFDWSSLNTDKYQVGAVKLVADGSIQGYTGFLTRPYHRHEEPDYIAYPTMAQQRLDDIVLRLHQRDQQMAIHANGDAAIDAVISAFAKAQAEHPRKDPRAVVIHAQMSRQDQLEQMQALGLTPSFFNSHVYYWGDRHRDVFIGPERAANISPTASAEALGLVYSLHLDYPVVPLDAMTMLWSAVARETSGGQILGAHQRISVEQALRAMTLDAAWQIFREQDLGSIEVGKLADMVVLSDDPSREGADIRGIQVLQTYVGGRKLYQRR